MAPNKVDRKRVTVTPLDEFLRKLPDGFSREDLASGVRVHSDPERSLVLIDGLSSCGRSVFFCGSLGRKIKLRNLWEYTAIRSSLLSKRIYLLVSAREDHSDHQGSHVVSIDGCDPFIKWQMERGLDWTISSVRGESYRVDIDLSDLLQSSEVMTPTKATRVWRDAYFTLKYSSDALFDFSHWFGLSKRAFKLRRIGHFCFFKKVCGPNCGQE